MFVCTECGGAQPTAGHCPTDGVELAAIGEDVLLGTTIGAYRVARLLGIGGMGRVYKGVHPMIGSRVAIKVLSRECSDRQDLVERFFAEAKAVNLIRHESIVNVLDQARLPDGRPYIIMEYLDGAPLAAILDHSQAHGIKLPFGGIARFAVEVLDALQATHAKGIVHRDLKPDNIFVAPSGRPKVLDFGIAKLTDPTANSSTRTGSLLGTPHYMSPEQASGRPVDHRADLYAIGVILYECVTGRKLFVADSLFDLLRKHVEEPPTPPRTFRPDLDPALESLILCALAKHPDQRFATAQAMSLALQHATAHLAPDQWMPITSSGTHQAIPSWHQQAPATWSSRVQRVDQPTRGVPRPSEQPIASLERANNLRPPPLGNSTTVSASSGQVQKQPADNKSKRGLLLVLAGIVIGGGVAAVALTQRGGSAEPVAANDTPAPPPDKPAEPAPKVADKPAAPKVEAKKTDEILDEQDLAEIKAAKQAIDSALDDVQSRAAVPKGAPKVEKGDDEPMASPARGAWVESRALQLANFNPKKVDIDAFVKFAIAEARKVVPDAQLTRVDVTGVSPDGYADLTLPTLASGSGDIDIRFISPSASKLDPKIPVGVPQQRLCEFRISGAPDGIEIRSMFKSDCKTKIVAIPTCGYGSLWKKAATQGAPGNAVAQIAYYAASMHSTPKWFFTIGFGHDVAFSKMWNGPGC